MVTIERVLENRLQAGLEKAGVDAPFRVAEGTLLFFAWDVGRRTKLVEALPYIAAVVYNCSSLQWIRIGEDSPQSVQELVHYFPVGYEGGVVDERLEQEQKAQGLVLADFLLRCALEDGRSFFLVDAEGNYQDVRLPPTADPPVPAAEMVGRNISEVMGAESLQEVLRAVKRCLESGSDEAAYYGGVVGGQERIYIARVGKYSAGLAALLVERLR